MEELIVDGLVPKDFIILEAILKDYKTSLNGDISFEEVLSIYQKVKQVVDYLGD